MQLIKIERGNEGALANLVQFGNVRAYVISHGKKNHLDESIIHRVEQQAKAVAAERKVEEPPRVFYDLDYVEPPEYCFHVACSAAVQLYVERKS